MSVMPNNNSIVINKELVRQRFANACVTYNQHAVVQREMAYELVMLAKRYVPHQLLKTTELGCGTGLLTHQIVQAFDVVEYVANDMVEEVMFSTLAILCDGGVKNCFFLPNDIEKMALPTVQNVIWSGAVIQWISDLKSFFERAAESLVDDGFLVVSSFLEANFHEIKTITGKGIEYKTLDCILALANDYFDVVEVKHYKRQLFFSSAAEVLRHMSFTGVNGVSSKSWTRSDLLQFEKTYLNFKTEEGYPLTYHPVMMVFKKRSLLV